MALCSVRRSAIVPHRNELVQHKRKNDELTSYIKKQKLKYHGVRIN